MTGTRYEFGGTGIFHAIGVLEDMSLSPANAGDLEWASRKMEEELVIPDIFLDTKFPTRSFFTEQGLTRLHEPLEILLRLFGDAEETGIGILRVIREEITDACIIYKDMDQIVAKKGDCYGAC